MDDSVEGSLVKIMASEHRFKANEGTNSPSRPNPSKPTRRRSRSRDESYESSESEVPINVTPFSLNRQVSVEASMCSSATPTHFNCSKLDLPSSSNSTSPQQQQKTQGDLRSREQASLHPKDSADTIGALIHETSSQHRVNAPESPERRTSNDWDGHTFPDGLDPELYEEDDDATLETQESPRVLPFMARLKQQQQPASDEHSATESFACDSSNDPHRSFRTLGTTSSSQVTPKQGTAGKKPTARRGSLLGETNHEGDEIEDEGTSPDPLRSKVISRARELLGDSFKFRAEEFDVDAPGASNPTQYGQGGMLPKNSLSGAFSLGNSTLSSHSLPYHLTDEQKAWEGVSRVIEKYGADDNSLPSTDILPSVIMNALQDSSSTLSQSDHHNRAPPSNIHAHMPPATILENEEADNQSSSRDPAVQQPSDSPTGPGGGMPDLMTASFSSLMTENESLVSKTSPVRNYLKSHNNVVVQNSNSYLPDVNSLVSSVAERIKEEASRVTEEDAAGGGRESDEEKQDAAQEQMEEEVSIDIVASSKQQYRRKRSTDGSPRRGSNEDLLGIRGSGDAQTRKQSLGSSKTLSEESFNSDGTKPIELPDFGSQALLPSPGDDECDDDALFRSSRSPQDIQQQLAVPMLLHSPSLTPSPRRKKPAPKQSPGAIKSQSTKSGSASPRQRPRPGNNKPVGKPRQGSPTPRPSSNQHKPSPRRRRSKSPHRKESESPRRRRPSDPHQKPEQRRRSGTASRNDSRSRSPRIQRLNTPKDGRRRSSSERTSQSSSRAGSPQRAISRSITPEGLTFDEKERDEPYGPHLSPLNGRPKQLLSALDVPSPTRALNNSMPSLATYQEADLPLPRTNDEKWHSYGDLGFEEEYCGKPILPLPPTLEEASIKEESSQQGSPRKPPRKQKKLKPKHKPKPKPMPSGNASASGEDAVNITKKVRRRKPPSGPPQAGPRPSARRSIKKKKKAPPKKIAKTLEMGNTPVVTAPLPETPEAFQEFFRDEAEDHSEDHDHVTVATSASRPSVASKIPVINTLSSFLAGSRPDSPVKTNATSSMQQQARMNVRYGRTRTTALSQFKKGLLRLSFLGGGNSSGEHKNNSRVIDTGLRDARFYPSMDEEDDDGFGSLLN